MGDYAPTYYEQYFNYYFEQHPANAKLQDLESIRSTFNQGAYFRAQIDDHLHVLALNTLVYNVEDVSDDANLKQTQLTWYREQLETAQPHEKFVVMSHIYETVGNDSDELEVLWNEDSYLQSIF